MNNFITSFLIHLNQWNNSYPEAPPSLQYLFTIIFTKI